MILRVDNADELTVLRTFLFEFHETVFFREQRMIAADTNITARMDARAPLTNNYVSGNNALTAKHLNAQAFTL